MLGDLVPLGQVVVVIMLALKAGPRADAAPEGEARAHRLPHRFLVQNGERACVLW